MTDRAPEPDIAYCAHLRVSYKPIDNPDGTKTERWLCDYGCGATFIPSKRAEATIERLDVDAYNRAQDAALAYNKAYDNWQREWELRLKADATISELTRRNEELSADMKALAAHHKAEEESGCNYRVTSDDKSSDVCQLAEDFRWRFNNESASHDLTTEELRRVKIELQAWAGLQGTTRSDLESAVAERDELRAVAENGVALVEMLMEIAFVPVEPIRIWLTESRRTIGGGGAMRRPIVEHELAIVRPRIDLVLHLEAARPSGHGWPSAEMLTNTDLIQAHVRAHDPDPGEYEEPER